MPRRILSSLARAVLLTLPLVPIAAQTETTLLQIAQGGIGSNGFSTTWRGQDVQLVEDAWLTRIAFSTGSATSNVDEVRLMTAVPNAITLRSVQSPAQSTNEVEAVLAQPYLLRGGTRYTIWFHQTGTPRGTSGCDLSAVDPTWLAWHTNVDPSQAPGAGEPGYWWGYRYGTNMRLVGFDNLEITGTLVPGGNARFDLEARPNDFAVILFALGIADRSFPGAIGPLRLDPALLLPAQFSGNVGPTGLWINTLPVPNDPALRGGVLWTQAAYDPTFASGATLSPLEELRIR